MELRSGHGAAGSGAEPLSRLTNRDQKGNESHQSSHLCWRAVADRAAKCVAAKSPVCAAESELHGVQQGG